MSFFIFKIRACHKKLGDGVVILGKKLIIGIHQFTLAYSGCGLLGSNITRSFA